MAGYWRLAFHVLLTSLSVYCANNPQQKQRRTEQQAGVSTQTAVTLGGGQVVPGAEAPGRGRVKRKTAECTIIETPSGGGLHKIIDADAETTYNFFIKPQLGFNQLVVNAKLQNKLIHRGYSTKSLIVGSSQMTIDWTHPNWIPVEIEYFKKIVRFGPDRHGLCVRVGENVSEELITSWWRTHSYEGFTVYAEGPLKVSKCNSWGAVPKPVVDRGGVSQTLLIACVLSGCFLLGVGAATLCLIARRCRSPQQYQNDLPSVPRSLLQECRIKRDGDSEHIYESIDERTLAKLQKNSYSDILAVSRTQRVKDHSGCSNDGYQSMKAFLGVTVQEPCHFSGIPNNGAESTQTINLREQKEALREDCDLDSPVESHYVEMHSIVNRTSSLNK
ncbi:hypothetical protein GWK47_020464 [Chionoecetes opilio]|uniref:Uncharacterized protein n=1 Tax=Chionoecetes opilio TaxID=41210 RepID=A0A8J5CHH1_CHIOP|nr:hypothetical protein GWK47_020464 [Chionoecetes opilio]